MRLQDGAQSKVLLERIPELSREPAPELVDHRDHEIVARREMQKHHPVRHPNRLGDVGGRRIHDALARKQRHGRVDQAVARHHFLFLPSRRLHCSPYRLLSIYSLSIYSADGHRVKRLDDDGWANERLEHRAPEVRV